MCSVKNARAAASLPVSIANHACACCEMCEAGHSMPSAARATFGPTDSITATSVRNQGFIRDISILRSFAPGEQDGLTSNRCESAAPG